MVDKNIVAIIPARGGSKRIPKKNIIELGGKPMIAWTIEAASRSKYISQIIVSTDDEEIASVSKTYGAQVPFLRKGSADDQSPVSLATIRTVAQMEEAGMKKPDIVVQLMANCPLRGAEDINLAIENFLHKKNVFQISSFKFGWMNPWWAYKVDAEGNPAPVFPVEQRVMRSQDQPDLFCPTGAIWIAKTDQLVESESFYGPGHKFFPLHWKRAVDIDDYEDLEMAKIFLNL